MDTSGNHMQDLSEYVDTSEIAVFPGLMWENIGI